MDERTQNAQAEREQIIQSLTRSILDAAKPHIDPATPQAEIDKRTREITERLQFESSVALSELVTRFSKTTPVDAKPTEERTFLRFGRNFRAQHMLMFTSIILLILTGMPLKFPEFGISKFMIVTVFGGLQNSTLIHRIAAVGLIIVGAWHLGYIIFSRMGRRDFWLMIPRPQDAKDAFHTVLYYIGRKPSGPKFGRFSFIEKFDYWAVYWGMVVMIGSGLILWFKEMFNKGLFDIAREAHSDEGLLATLAIIIWHFYNVHFNPEVFPMSWVWWTGRLTESELKHHHPLEYAEIVNAERKAVELRAEKQSASSESGS
ncbi:MAG: cytochrome b/b6 domain-containing protein [bacterium]|nr:cytochrome b/b6 domain-containing protein [bacterium]